jgi:hypothetical protein
VRENFLLSRLVEGWIDARSVFRGGCPRNGEGVAVISSSLTATVLPHSLEVTCA